MQPRLPKVAGGAIDESHIHRLATETAPESRGKLRAAGAASDDDYLAPGRSRTHLTASTGASRPLSPRFSDKRRGAGIGFAVFTIPAIPLWTNRAEPIRSGRRRVCATLRPGPSFPDRFQAAF